MNYYIGPASKKKNYGIALKPKILTYEILSTSKIGNNVAVANSKSLL